MLPPIQLLRNSSHFSKIVKINTYNTFKNNQIHWIIPSAHKKTFICHFRTLWISRKLIFPWRLLYKSSSNQPNFHNWWHIKTTKDAHMSNVFCNKMYKLSSHAPNVYLLTISHMLILRNKILMFVWSSLKMFRSKIKLALLCRIPLWDRIVQKHVRMISRSKNMSLKSLIPRRNLRERNVVKILFHYRRNLNQIPTHPQKNPAKNRKTPKSPNLMNNHNK